MSANFDDEVSGPFDGPFDSPGPAPKGYDPKGYDADYGDDLGPYDDQVAATRTSSGGLELVGGALFLAGFIPAAAVAKAISAGTDLEAGGLGGTAALAATASRWLGMWPALVTSAVIGIIGSLMVLGTLRTDPLRRVAGVAVSGLGLAAIFGALTSSPAQGLLGAGGRIGSGTGGAMADAAGAWAGILLGLLVIAGAAWLGFGPSEAAIDEDDGLGPILERGESRPESATGAASSAVAWAAGAAVSVGAAAAAAGSGLFKRQPRSESEVMGSRGDRQRRVSNKKVRRAGAPVTLGDALARRGSEGVSHDEAAALAPDDKTLAYMEDVWRRASDTVDQPEPVPKSPYPEDVRLKGQIPEGAAPLKPRLPGDEDHAVPPTGHAAATTAPKDPGQPTAPILPVPPVPMPYFGEGSSQDVAPFDFEDELSPPKPLNSPPPPVTQPVPKFQTQAADPFGAPELTGGLTNEEADAYRDAVLREGASAQGPSDLPEGVKPFTPKPKEDEEAPGAQPAAPLEVPIVSSSQPVSPTAEADPMAKQAMQAGAMPASVSLPPRPAWEQGYDDDEPGGPLESDLVETIPDVDETGRWQRRNADGELEDAMESEMSVPSMSVLDELLAQVESDEAEAEAALVAEAEAPVETAVEAPALEEAELDDDVEDEPELELDAELLEEADELAEDEEEGEEEEYEEEDELEAAELAEDGEEEEYEYVDEDGNPIDPADLSEEYELVDEDEDEDEEGEEADEDEEAEYEEYDDEEEYEEDEEAEEAAEYEEEPEEAAEAEGSDDVILEPQAPPAASTSAPAAAETSAETPAETPGALADAFSEPISPDGSRLREAGRLVVSVNRAAVSVIQKGFDVEFAEACSILEALHAEGLIGPYQEGKKRAILMSLDEWDGRFAHS